MKINGITDKSYLNIIDSIAKIKDYDISFKLDKSYDRIEKINKYLIAISDYLDSNIVNKIKSQLNKIKTLEFDTVISHGDLIPPNIFKDKDQIKFIDWEYVGMKPKYYDIIYFLLFADNPKNVINSIDKYIRDETIKKEMLKDAVVITLREIKNWSVVSNKQLKEEYIKIWRESLKTFINNLN